MTEASLSFIATTTRSSGISEKRSVASVAKKGRIEERVSSSKSYRCVWIRKRECGIQDGNIAIPGSKNPAHIKDNFALFDFALTDEEMAKIAALDQQKRYYHSTPELLEQYVQMVPPVDEQK